MKLKTLLAILSLACLACSPSPIASVKERKASIAKLERLLEDKAPHTKNLQSRIASLLQSNLDARRLSSEVNAAWQIMHGVICYGRELRIATPDQGLVSAVDYAFSGGEVMGFELMPGSDILPTTGRRGLKARLEPGSYVGQGHVDQWLAVFAMAALPLETPIELNAQQFAIRDLARQAQFDVTNNLLDEFSWTLIALTHYFPDEPTWHAADGSMVSWEMLVEAELTYDVDLSPCGGTHRLAGITRAVQAKERLGLADSPTWNEAKQRIEACLTSAKQYRASDGSFSSYYFERPGATADLSAVLAGSGHVLEFVALAAPADELSANWIELGVTRLCDLLESTREVELDCGALYHALNGLRIYQQRVASKG